MNLGCQRNYHKGREAIRIYANQPNRPLWPLRRCPNFMSTYRLFSIVSWKLVGAFNQEKILVGAFSVIAKSLRNSCNLRFKLYERWCGWIVWKSDNRIAWCVPLLAPLCLMWPPITSIKNTEQLFTVCHHSSAARELDKHAQTQNDENELLQQTDFWRCCLFVVRIGPIFLS